MHRNTIGTSAAALATGVLLAIAVPLTASAHVTLASNRAAAGSDALLSFIVPTESATATTTKLELTIPQATPFADVSYIAVPGWTTQLVKETLDTPIIGDNGSITEAVTHVVWTATPGSEIVAGQVGIFPLEVGPVPNTGSIGLAIDQTYSDGTVVSWSETGENAKHPVPVLYVNDTPSAGDKDTSEPGAEVTATAGAVPYDAGTGAEPDVPARVLGIGGLVLGVIALVVAITTRRPTAGTPEKGRASGGGE